MSFDRPGRARPPAIPAAEFRPAAAALLIFLIVAPVSASSEREVPPLRQDVNDFAGIMPQASIEELSRQLHEQKKRTGRTVVVVTVPALGEPMESFAAKTFGRLPLSENELGKTALLVIAWKERRTGVHVGDELRPLFPEPAATDKIHAHASLYFNGLRPDLGIHSAVNYIFRIIKGEIRADALSEEEKLEDASISGAGAGAIFALFLAPYLAFMVGALWGLYAATSGIQRFPRLFVGAVLGGGTAKLLAAAMTFLGAYSDGLWYFILSLSIPLALFGCLTEFWMSGDWMGIPREKDATLRRKPTEKMGI
ncbi:MAG TPA: TPM domain-containing protein [candidate division Zixibacteria bacterium]|nr:TPM domain-containing protein [candidate division Zixibacteria bacterium]